MKLVFDSGPLIYLAKARILGQVNQLSKELVIPTFVYDEVVTKGKSSGKTDALDVDSLVLKGVFKVRDASDGVDHDHPTLSPADQSVINLAKEIRGIAVIDEDIGRSTAEVMGVPTLGSAGVVIRLLKRGHITKKQARQAIDSMISHGWYCSTDLYRIIVERLDKH